MNLMQVRLLLALEEHQFNLSKTAAALYIVQSAASRQLKLLEDEIGVPLLIREGKRLKGWTPVGEKVFLQAKSICLAQQNILNIAREAKSSTAGEIFLATTHTQAKYFLPERLIDFRTSYPKVQLHILQGSPVQLIEWLHEGKVDLALCTESIASASGLEKIDCYQWSYVLICPPEHPILEKKTVTWESLCKYPLLTYGKGFTGGGIIEEALSSRNLTAYFPLRAADSDVIKTYVKRGFGLGIIASQAFDAHEDNELVALSLSHLLPPNTTYVAWRKGQYLTAPVNGLIHLLTQSNVKKCKP